MTAVRPKFARYSGREIREKKEKGLFGLRPDYELDFFFFGGGGGGSGARSNGAFLNLYFSNLA